MLDVETTPVERPLELLTMQSARRLFRAVSGGSPFGHRLRRFSLRHAWLPGPAFAGMAIQVRAP
jgi:hypothetical protein